MTNDKILQTVDQISRKLDDVSQNNNDVKVEIARVIEQNTNQTRSLNEVKIAVDKLTQIVYTGNGQPSLMSRVSKIEVRSDENSKTIDEIKSVANEVAVESKRTDRKYNLILFGMAALIIVFAFDFTQGTEFVKFMISVVKG